MADLAPIETRLGISIHNPDLYDLSFTHKSMNGMLGTKHRDYERLEFLGDSLIGFVVGELCYKEHPELLQGDLTKLRSRFIKTASEAQYCIRLGLVPFIKTNLQDDLSHYPNILEDVFEAFIGALLLDQGKEVAYRVLVDLMKEDIKKASFDEMEENPKGTLQEIIQADHRDSVTYTVIGESGPDHQKHFVVAVEFEGIELGRGEGNSKKEAEFAAAKDALSKLAKGDND